MSEKASTTNVQYVHLRAVCKAWRRALTPNPRHLPRQTASPPPSCVSLHNPITRRSIELPSFDALPTILSGPISKRGSSIASVSTLHVGKVVLSCNPSELDCVVVARLMMGDPSMWELGFCRIGDTHWTGIMMRDACQPLMSFTCNNKSVYMVNTKLEMLAYDLESLTMRTFPSKINYNGMIDRIHLVEGDAEADGPLVVITTEYLGKLKQIYVYKWINYEQRWRRVKNIGKSVLFLSRDDCTKLQLEELNGNEIYYDIRHDLASRSRDDIFLSRDDIFLGRDDFTKLQLEVKRGNGISDVIRHDVAMGFRICINKMNLQSGGILPHCPNPREYFYNKLRPTLWFTPSLI
ncbi:F-box protein SKIP23-like protein [Carex littledalei]|uniref:F-box protein SKIP23-like protein n=1 Tax=Carex littledalei TaxID=544730 RepID=A0A833RHY2_9POAL|nr:F-box protein SKIP23-like protein [Carex littledalei]